MLDNSMLVPEVLPKITKLRPQLDERLQAALKLRLAEFGLAVAQVDTLSLRHDKFDSNRERVGSLWLVADERHAQLEHVKQLDELYNEEEWQAIWREEQKILSDFRRAELRQDAAVDKAELAQQEAERVQAIRARFRARQLHLVVGHHRQRRQAGHADAVAMSLLGRVHDLQA
eukprot:gene5253-6246_t